MTRTKKILIAVLIIIAIIAAIWFVCQVVIPLLIDAFEWVLQDFLPPIIVIVAIIVLGCMALNN